MKERFPVIMTLAQAAGEIFDEIARGFIRTRAGIALLWKRRGFILDTLRNAENLAKAVYAASPKDKEDIHTLDPNIYQAALAICYTISPYELEAMLVREAEEPTTEPIITKPWEMWE